MADDTMYLSRAKGRSASICATGSASMEAMVAAQETATSAHNTPEGGTPTGRRRRPAARSQSARIASGRSIRRRAAVAAAANHSHEVKSHYNSEPKLADDSSDISPGSRRRNSTRRGTSVYHRKSTAFLEIPDQRCAYGGGRAEEEEDEDSYRLRSFSFTSKG